MDAREKKLKMPVFEGEDAQHWVYRVERYVSINGFTEGRSSWRRVYIWKGKP
ncbi:hypothetical protein MA16_Dca011470 [Dendrobium catenatum]|uniref:Uncharacterized protein n=1 Tax=Dendrobium catenatum TaxID=906689 RepID=A0A2I0WKC1_9ASPA|nr:hypothetical protein MA16_Dca011470 [Dendrobium catenatum]